MSEENTRKTRDDFSTEAEYLTYLLVNPEEENVEIDPARKAILYYKCNNPKCSNVMKTNEEIHEMYIEQIKEALDTAICDKCGHVGFSFINEDEYIKIDKENKKQLKAEDLKKKNKVKNITYAIKYINLEREKLFKDLLDKLVDGQITPERFVAVFYHATYRLTQSAVRRYEIPNFDWSEQRKLIKTMTDAVLDRYEIKKEHDEIIEQYDIKNDELYKVYEEHYEKDPDEHDEIFAEYKRETRLNDYIKKISEKHADIENKRAEYRMDKKYERAEDKFTKNLKAQVKKL